MNNSSVSPVPFAELPSEARALLFIFAQAAAARYVAHPLKQSELTPLLETIWRADEALATMQIQCTAGLVLNCKMYIFSCLVCPMFWIPPNIPPMRFSWVGVSVSSE
jgi:hypothetical protein